MNKFNAKKAVQAAAKLLSFEHNSTMSRLRLLKLLYIAERKCLKQTGQLLIGDSAVAMDCGPLHSTVYSMIKGESIHDAQWSRYIRQVGPRDVHLHHPAGNSELSKFEVNLLQIVSETHVPFDDFDLVEITHHFDEYKKANAVRSPKSSKRIPLEDIIDGVCRSDDKDEIVQDLVDTNAFEEFFGAIR